MDNQWNTENQEIDNGPRQKIRVAIASIIGLVGLTIMLSQIFPLAGSWLSGKVYEIRASILAKPIPDSHKEYIEGEFAFYNPGQSYFQNLLRNADETATTLTYDPITKQLKQPIINTSYDKDMRLTIAG
ncbi:MAG TPA: hypothetical protein PLV59_04405, partial [Candidatus Dojkabacteria bacterium]|nr:hypothetical protein [Candidatus Dojkabacteria bacterium]